MASKSASNSGDLDALAEPVALAGQQGRHHRHGALERAEDRGERQRREHGRGARDTPPGMTDADTSSEYAPAAAITTPSHAARSARSSWTRTPGASSTRGGGPVRSSPRARRRAVRRPPAGSSRRRRRPRRSGHRPGAGRWRRGGRGPRGADRGAASRWPASPTGAARWVHADHVGALVGQQQGAQRTGEVLAEVDHADPAERTGDRRRAPHGTRRAPSRHERSMRSNASSSSARRTWRSARYCPWVIT